MSCLSICEVRQSATLHEQAWGAWPEGSLGVGPLSYLSISEARQSAPLRELAAR